MEFRAAYAASPSPLALGQMGLAEQALGQWVDAEAHIRAALAIEGDHWIDRHRDALSAAYAVINRHVGRLEIVGGLAGAELEVSGVIRGTLPHTEPIVLQVGDATIVVRRADRPARSHVVVIAAGSLVRDTIADELASFGTGNNIGFYAPGASTMRRANEAPNRVLRIVVATGAVGFLGTGILGLVLRESIVNDYNARCPGAGDPMPPANCDEALTTNDATRAGVLAATGFVATGVLGIVTAVLFARPATASSSGEHRPLAFHVGAGPGDIGIACGGSL